MPDSIKRRRIWFYENGDLESSNDIHELVMRLFNYPEDLFYLFSENKTPINILINSEVECGNIRITESQSRFYRHPKLKRDYVRIHEHDVKWEWQKRVIDIGPMYFRHELKLSEKARRTLQMEQLAKLQESRDGNPLILQPNYLGVGIDFKKLFMLLKRLCKHKE